MEIGWRLKEAHWGKGFATEAAQGYLKYGFSQLQFGTVYSFTAKVNKPSINVMKKSGMRFDRFFNHPKVSLDSPLSQHVLY